MNPEKYLISPSSPESQQAQQMQQMQQQQMQQQQEMERQQDRQFMMQLQTKQIQIAESEVQRNLKNDIEELQVRMAELQQKSEFDFAKLSVDTDAGRESDQLDSNTKLHIAGAGDQTTRDVAALNSQTDIATTTAKNEADREGNILKAQSDANKRESDEEIAEAKMVADAVTKMELESLKGLKTDNERPMTDEWCTD